MAQVDTSIYSNMLARPKSVEEYDQEFQQAKGNKLALMSQQAQYDQQQKSIADEQTMSSLYRNALNPDGSLDRTRLYTGAASSGLGSRIPALQKQFLDTDKTQAEVDDRRAGTIKTGAETEKVRFETALNKQKAIAELAATANDQASWSRAKMLASAIGADVSQVPDQYDPNVARQLADSAVSQVQRMEQMLKERQLAETIRNNTAQNRISQGNLAVAQGNLGLSRQRLDFDRSQPKGQYDAERGVLVDPRTGEARPVTMGGQPLGAKDKGAAAATEGERKAATLLTRLRGSKAQLDAALKADPGAAKPGVLSEAVRGIPLVGGDTPANMITSVSRQQVEAAQLDMLDAALTLGTGAAYTKEQLRGYAKSYFPQIGDDAKTVRDKQARLANVIRAAEIAAGRAEPSTPRFDGSSPASGASGGWSIQEVK